MFKPGHWPVATNSLFLWQALAVAVFPFQSTYSAVLESAKKDGCPLSSDFYTGGMKKSMVWTYSREEAEEKARKGYLFSTCMFRKLLRECKREEGRKGVTWLEQQCVTFASVRGGNSGLFGSGLEGLPAAAAGRARAGRARVQGCGSFSKRLGCAAHKPSHLDIQPGVPLHYLFSM